MHISTAARELDFSPPSILAAQSVALVLEQNGAIDRTGLLSTMEAVYGTPAADGLWSLRDAYDVLELAQVLYLQAAQLPVDPAKRLARLSALTASLPTHTVRSEQQIAMQQFSTPAPTAYLTTLAAGISADDIVLEPSAGTGLLAVFAKIAGARLILNELDPARAEMLECAFPESPVTRHDAEMIDDLLNQDQRPSAVLINPPFSRSVGRGVDSLAGFRHLRAALLRLAPAGRCAAILPDRIDTTSQAWNIATQGCGLSLYLELPANAYAKHGTSQAVKIVVLQKESNAKAKLERCNMYLVHGGDMRGLDGLAASWAEQNGIQQVRFGLDRKLGDRAGFRRNEQMLSLSPRYVIAFQGNGVSERLVIDAKKQGIRIVDRRGPLGTPPTALNP